MYKKYNMARTKGAMLRRMEDYKYKLYWALHPEFAEKCGANRCLSKSLRGKMFCLMTNRFKKPDLSKLNGRSFGANRIYLIKEEGAFEPTFIASIDAKLPLIP